MALFGRNACAILVASVMLLAQVACAPGACLLQLLASPPAASQAQKPCCAAEDRAPAPHHESKCPLCDGAGMIIKTADAAPHYSAHQHLLPVPFGLAILNLQLTHSPDGQLALWDFGPQWSEQSASATLVKLHCALLT